MSFNPGKLRACPECGSPWRHDVDHALRGCGWLYGLSRSITPSNNDVQIHDGAGQRNRFLHFEVKRPDERTIQPGQLRLLTGLARLSAFTVRILRGTTAAVEVRAVTPAGIGAESIVTHAEAIRKAVDMWVQGALWRDAEEVLRKNPVQSAAPSLEHVHGWGRIEGVWTCIQDHYAVGVHTETGCGETLPQFP